MRLFNFKDKCHAISIKQSTKEMLEVEIEELLENNPILLTGETILYIGRQVQTDLGKKLDLLAIDKYGRLVIAELKRGYAPREIIAQVLDYTSWLRKLSEREIEQIAKQYFEKRQLRFRTLHEAFEKTFNRTLKNAIGEEILIILFANDFSQEVIRPAAYLNETGVPINCIKFDLFTSEDGDNYFLIQNVVGDEFEENQDRESHVPIAKKATFKQLIDRLTKKLEEVYGEWSLNLGAERLHPFKTYQDRQGTWTCSYIDWLYKDETKFCLEVAIYPEEEDEEQGLCVYLHARKKSPTLTRFFSSGSDILNILEEYDDESEQNKPQYAKYISMEEITYERLEELALKEIEKIKPLIEEILK